MKEPYPAEKARGGEIILRRRWQRIVFIAGLVGWCWSRSSPGCC